MEKNLEPQRNSFLIELDRSIHKQEPIRDLHEQEIDRSQKKIKEKKSSFRRLLVIVNFQTRTRKADGTKFYQRMSLKRRRQGNGAQRRTPQNKQMTKSTGLDELMNDFGTEK